MFAETDAHHDTPPPRPEPRARVLIVDDDEAVRISLERGLRLFGFDVEVATGGVHALEVFDDDRIEAVVLDMTMPDRSGMSVISELRDRGSTVPICVLSARSSPESRIAGLEAGADDYLVKPFVLAELTARLGALLRRRRGEPLGQRLRPRDIVVDTLRIDLPARRAFRGDTEITLTRREFDLLATFAENPDRVLSRAELLETVWGYNFATDTNVADVFVGYLRRKTEIGDAPRVIHTVRGIGYILRAPTP
ncbi:response regulator transcription factor [Gordonia rhizosphera]|uniref:Two-component response regulator PrrA n=1 Tax=Gordonia rhizosphera NBRC 16068 TaxID=1108045 RepID=K6WNB9_9ACTN|nr:response regulator transcription factor [Gordonia rhizosphera]GAB93642.1 two-component response regulator PrrA [Gordonia rhizosphera NBRC 16068]